MIIYNSLGHDLNNAAQKPQLDANFKKVFSHSALLVYFLKDCVKEFKNCSEHEILESILEDSISLDSPVDPSVPQDVQDNISKEIEEKTSATDMQMLDGSLITESVGIESLSSNEGKICYDIRFSVKTPTY